MKNLILILFGLILTLSGCEKGDMKTIVCGFECDQKVIVNEDQYANAPADQLTIYEAKIHGDCLHIKFASSGCSEDSWKVKLVASELEYFSLPPQRDVRLSLDNKELCEAYITKEMTFDMKELRSSGDRSQLNIVNGDTSVLYAY